MICRKEEERCILVIKTLNWRYIGSNNGDLGSVVYRCSSHKQWLLYVDPFFVYSLFHLFTLSNKMNDFNYLYLSSSNQIEFSYLFCGGFSSQMTHSFVLRLPNLFGVGETHINTKIFGEHWRVI